MNKVYHINQELNRVYRKNFVRVKTEASTVAKMLFVGFLTREKSINQIMEKVHVRKKYKALFKNDEYIPKMHGFREGIKNLISEGLTKINQKVIKKSKENKVYRDGCIDRLVVVGFDGVETFGSYKKDWKNSYKTKIKIKKYNNGEKLEEEKEYHKQINVFAKIVGKKPGLILGYEKVTCNGKKGKQQYEPDVGIKLVNRLGEMYGRGIDVIVLDAIYLKENVIKAIKKAGYEAVIRLKENNKGILRNAEGIFKIEKPIEWKSKRKVVNTNIHSEREIKSWSTNLMYKGELVKVVKFEEKYKKGKEKQKDIIYVISTDVNMKEQTINKIIHSRWDIENNGFNELKNYWNMNHCYMAEENEIDVILEMMILSYNLWELYLYGHLHDFEGKKITKIGYIEEFREQLAKMKKEEVNFSSA